MSKLDTSSTFTDNMSLPVHRWYRYSAGFSAEWAEEVVEKYKKYIKEENIKVLDPFAGSGTTLLACDKSKVESYGYEAHPLIYKIARAKLEWDADVRLIEQLVDEVLEYARKTFFTMDEYPDIVKRCYDEENLRQINALKHSIEHFRNHTKEYDLIWLGFVSVLRSASHAGTATWQYVLPNKKKVKVLRAFDAFEKQMDMICRDLIYFQNCGAEKKSCLLEFDARKISPLKQESIDLIVTSPPYANNYDYADATRLELSVLGEVRSWGDLQSVIRPGLVRSCSQMVSKERKDTYKYLQDPVLEPIYEEIVEKCCQLEMEKENHGGKKNYYTMIALYFLDLGKIWRHLRKVCKKDSLVCFVIGDSAPYGVYIPVEEWLGRLAVAAGFKEYWFEKTRDRNVKWKNRKHTVPLKEGRLWVRG